MCLRRFVNVALEENDSARPQRSQHRTQSRRHLTAVKAHDHELSYLFLQSLARLGSHEYSSVARADDPIEWRFRFCNWRPCLLSKTGSQRTGKSAIEPRLIPDHPCKSVLVLNWRLATGDWRLATGDWRLATGDRRLATGDWPLPLLHSICLFSSC